MLTIDSHTHLGISRLSENEYTEEMQLENQKKNPLPCVHLFYGTNYVHF